MENRVYELPSDVSLTVGRLLLFSLAFLPLIINSSVATSFDEVYSHPKIWWIYGVLLPCAAAIIWSGRVALASRVVRPLLIFSTVFLSWLLISTLLTGNQAANWLGPQDRADGVIMHIIYVSVLFAGWLLAQFKTFQLGALLVLR